MLDGDCALCHVEDVLQPREDQLILDVRTPDEVKGGTIPGAKNIPLDKLRDRLGELPQDKEALVFCAAGLRGYLACRILAQRGYRARSRRWSPRGSRPRERCHRGSWAYHRGAAVLSGRRSG